MDNCMRFIHVFCGCTVCSFFLVHSIPLCGCTTISPFTWDDISVIPGLFVIQYNTVLTLTTWSWGRPHKLRAQLPTRLSSLQVHSPTKNLYQASVLGVFQCSSFRVLTGVSLHRYRFVSWVRKIPWRRKWQPTPVFLPGESHGQRSLASCSPRDRKSWTRLSD